MGDSKIEEILAGMAPEERKGFLDSLVSSVVSGMNETDRKEMLQTVLAGQRENRQLESMVEH